LPQQAICQLDASGGFARSGHSDDPETLATRAACKNVFGQ